MKIKKAFTLTEGATHVANIKRGRKFGFTLAEVLVTLGIIGVVSAMTIPSLTQNWQKRAYVTQLHKAYSEIQQAFVNEMNQKSATNLMEAGIRRTEQGDFMRRQFKIVKDCNFNSVPTPCFARSYKNLNGTSFDFSTFDNYSIITGSGYAISLFAYSARDANSDNENRTHCGTIYVDINGPKGPNIWGRDMFQMFVNPDGSLDSAGVTINCKKNGTNCGSGDTPKETREDNYSNSCKSAYNGDQGGCFGKILNDNWEMKY